MGGGWQRLQVHRPRTLGRTARGAEGGLGGGSCECSSARLRNEAERTRTARACGRWPMMSPGGGIERYAAL
eukprot:6218888-Prymnesium_polylepis.1